MFESGGTVQPYRRSTIGVCLRKSLVEMVTAGALSPELANRFLIQFDKSMAEALSKSKLTVKVKADLHNYRFCDDVWTFSLQNAELKIGEDQLTVKALKIIACDSKIVAKDNKLKS